MRLLIPASIAAVASRELVQLRNTAVAKISIRSQEKWEARRRWALMVLMAFLIPVSVMVPSLI